MSSSSPAKAIPLYQHTQRGYLLLVIAVIAMIAAYGFHVGGEYSPFKPVAAFLVILAAMFSDLTIRVDGAEIRWWFGVGWPGGAIALAEVERAEPVRSTVLQGWGLHLTRFGWLWNVEGFNAVRLYRTGKPPVTLGTNDLQGLQEAIARVRGT